VTDATASFWVPAVDLAAQYRELRAQIDEAIGSVLASGHYTLGPHVRAFEREFARYCARRYAIGVASCTDALKLVLTALRIGPGAEVITTPLTFVATASAIRRTGARPVFVDVDPVTFTIDPKLALGAMTESTRAIVPVHLFGHPADMDELMSGVAGTGVAVVADTAQAVGSGYQGRPVGALGHAAVFSFFPAKVLGCYGDAGAVVTDNERLARQVVILRDHGFDGVDVVHPGMNSRMDELQAAVLSVKLSVLADDLRRRRAVAAYYDELLAASPVVTPTVKDGAAHSYYQYTVLVPDARDEAVEFLRSRGVDARVYYAKPLHHQPVFADLGYRRGALPAAEDYAARAISLPCHPRLSRDQQEYVCESLLRKYGE
jgi:dTDP-4-amino-4,6-dideoxygalactose transaminase